MATLDQLKTVIDAFEDDEVVGIDKIATFISTFGQLARKPTIRKRATEIAERLAAMGMSCMSALRRFFRAADCV